MTGPTSYSAFLIRWQENADGGRWHSSVENAYTGEVVYFASRLDLLNFLWKSLRENPSTANPPDTRPGPHTAR